MGTISNSRDKIYRKISNSKNIDEYKSFAVRELEFYDWIRANQNNYLKNNFSENMRIKINDKLGLLSNILSLNKIEDALSLFNQYHSFNIPYKDDLLGIFLSKITDPNKLKENFRKQIFVFSGSNFFSEFQVQINTLYSSDFITLVNELIWSSQQRDNIENLKNNSDLRYVENYVNFVENSISSIEVKGQEVASIHNKYIDQFNEDNFRRRRRIKNLSKFFGSQTRKIKHEIEQKRKEFEDLKASFIDYMHLSAPATYWQERANEANKARIGYSLTFIFLLGVFCFLFGVFIFPLLKEFVEMMSKSDKYPIFEVSIFISISAFSFWLLRLVARLALSSHHLKIDADERDVMIRTYLALIKEGGASEKEREIILHTIFKPTSDGIVKEDPQFEHPVASLARNKLGNI